MDALRAQRVSQAMRDELSELIRFECDDPRLSGVDVTDVIVSPDMKRADILVSLPRGAAERQAALAALVHAKGYLRQQVAQRIDLFHMPDLRFTPDREEVSGAPVDRLLRRARRGRPKIEAGGEAETP
jgi:ribosome-binding factor A